MMNFTPSFKRKVTNDWAALFPALEAAQPGRLFRRHGPLLVGICLDGAPGDDYYIPRTHFHNLSSPFPVISLSLSGPVLNKVGHPARLRVADHEARFQQFAATLKQAYPFIEKDTLDFNEFVEVTRNYLQGKHGLIVPYQDVPYTNIVLVASYLGLADYAREALARFCKEMEQWPSRAFNIIFSLEKWRTNLESQIGRPHELKAVVEQELNRHGLAQIADKGLECPSSPTIL